MTNVSRNNLTNCHKPLTVRLAEIINYYHVSNGLYWRKTRKEWAGHNHKEIHGEKSVIDMLLYHSKYYSSDRSRFSSVYTTKVITIPINLVKNSSRTRCLEVTLWGASASLPHCLQGAGCTAMHYGIEASTPTRRPQPFLPYVASSASLCVCFFAKCLLPFSRKN